MSPVGWKPKEKPLSPEEAIALARQQLAPLWHRSPPLFAGLRTGPQKASIHPLNETFASHNWLVHVLNPLDYSGERATHILHEWHRRYAPHDLRFLVIARVEVPTLNRPEIIHRALARWGVDFPAVLDQDGAITDGFAFSTSLFSHGKPVFSANGLEDGVERQIQQFLRGTDPGLPLLRELKLAAPVAGAQLRISGHPAGVALAGSWKEENGACVSVGDDATIQFQARAPRVGMVVELRGTDPLGSCFAIEVNGRPAYESIAGEDVHFDENGGAIVKVKQGSFYHLLHDLPAHEREICLRFRRDIIVHTLSFDG